MAADSSTLAWKIPWTEEPGGLRSMGWHSQTRLKRLSSSSSNMQIITEIFCILFSVLSEIQCVFYIYESSQFCPAMSCFMTGGYCIELGKTIIIFSA